MNQSPLTSWLILEGSFSLSSSWKNTGVVIGMIEFLHTKKHYPHTPVCSVHLWSSVFGSFSFPWFRSGGGRGRGRGGIRGHGCPVEVVGGHCWRLGAWLSHSFLYTLYLPPLHLSEAASLGALIPAGNNEEERMGPRGGAFRSWSV